MKALLKDPFKTVFPDLFRQMIRRLEQLVYPLKCLKCGTLINPDSAVPDTMEVCFCVLCMRTGLSPIQVPYCTLCGIQFSRHSHDDTAENHICQSCMMTPLKVSRARGAIEYKGIIKEAIPLFKYQARLSLAVVFELILFQAFLTHYADAGIDRIIPIPLHRSKLKERGFNQAYLMIRNFKTLYYNRLGHFPSWEIDARTLVRTKKTAPQTGFDILERKRNLQQAFKTARPDRVKGRHILLVDDVLTTGATCNEASDALLKQGASQVDVLVLARA